MVTAFKLTLTLIMWMNSASTERSYDSPDKGTLRSMNAKVTGSSQFDHIFRLSNLVDGSTSTNGDTCHCCAATKTETDPWMRVDLGRPYRISTVELFGRTNKYQVFAGINVIIENITLTESLISDEVRRVVPSMTNRNYTITFDNPVIGQYVTLQLEGMTLLLLCELHIYSKDCSSGLYGQFCNETCGHCQKHESCDHVTGTCSRCATGYLCEDCKTGCDPGTYGENCSNVCGHCNGNETCDIVTGACNVCSNGYTGQNCTLNCSDGFYGPECSSKCGYCGNNMTCNFVDGRCEGECMPGYIGEHCNEESGDLQQETMSASYMWIVIGAVGGVVGTLLLAATVIGILNLTRRNIREPTYDTMVWTTGKGNEQSVYTTLDL